MAHRTQITLDDGQYERLRSESERSGLSMAEIIRRKLDLVDGRQSCDERRAALRASFGAWADRDFDGEQYVERMRAPGLAARLRRYDS